MIRAAILAGKTKRKRSQRNTMGGFSIHADRLSAFCLGVDWIKVHEPALEERSRHGLKRGVHLAIELNLVVEGRKEISYSSQGSVTHSKIQVSSEEIARPNPLVTT